MRGLSRAQGLPRFKKFSDSSIFEEVFPSKRTKMYLGKMSTYTCIKALKFCMKAIFLMQIQNSKSDFRGFDFLLFLGIKSESNQYTVFTWFQHFSRRIIFGKGGQIPKNSKKFKKIIKNISIHFNSNFFLMYNHMKNQFWPS